MGRPLKRDKNGVLVFGTYTGDAGIRCEAYIGGSNQNDVYIVRQRGVKTYVVRDTSSGTELTARLVTMTALGVVPDPAAEGEMRITGYIDGADTAIYLRKLTKKTAIDYNNNKYRWELTNYQDSTADQIKLTPYV
jgi:hypothetical protein